MYFYYEIALAVSHAGKQLDQNINMMNCSVKKAHEAGSCRGTSFFRSRKPQRKAAQVAEYITYQFIDVGARMILEPRNRRRERHGQVDGHSSSRSDVPLLTLLLERYHTRSASLPVLIAYGGILLRCVMRGCHRDLPTGIDCFRSFHRPEGM